MKKSNKQLKQAAYKLGLKFINTRLEEEVIFIKLEKQGISKDIAKEVASNIVLQRNKNNKLNFSDYKNLAFVLFIVWAIAYIIAYTYTGDAFIGITFLVFTVLPSAIIGYLMTTTKLPLNRIN